MPKEPLARPPNGLIRLPRLQSPKLVNSESKSDLFSVNFVHNWIFPYKVTESENPFFRIGFPDGSAKKGTAVKKTLDFIVTLLVTVVKALTKSSWN